MAKIVVYGGTAYEVDESGRRVRTASFGQDVVANMLVAFPIVFKFMAKFVIKLARLLMAFRNKMVSRTEREFYTRFENEKLKFVEGNGYIALFLNMTIAGFFGSLALYECMLSPFYRLYRLVKTLIADRKNKKQAENV